MSVFRSYGEGIKEATLQPKMISVLWFINFIFGAVIFYLFYGRFSEVIGSSLIADKLLKKLDYNFVFEFLVYNGQFTKTIFFLAFVLILVYFLVSIFLYGGILNRLVYSPKSYEAGRDNGRFAPVFFQGGGKFFGRFLRLTIYSLILWFVVLVFFFGLTRLTGALSAKGTKEQLSFYLFIVEVVIGLFLIYLIKMILDYTRIKIVTEDTRYVFRSLFQTIGFVFKNFGKTLGIYYLLVLTGIVIIGIYWLLRQVIPDYSLLTILITFIIYQLFIASRGWLKVAFQAAQLSFSSPESLN